MAICGCYSSESNGMRKWNYWKMTRQSMQTESLRLKQMFEMYRRNDRYSHCQQTCDTGGLVCVKSCRSINAGITSGGDVIKMQIDILYFKKRFFPERRRKMNNDVCGKLGRSARSPKCIHLIFSTSVGGHLKGCSYNPCPASPPTPSNIHKA